MEGGAQARGVPGAPTQQGRQGVGPVKEFQEAAGIPGGRERREVPRSPGLESVPQSV